jgi:hypothetical protein
MKALFSTETRAPVRLALEQHAEQPGLSSYAFGALLLVALLGVPFLVRVLAFARVLVL